MMKLGDLLVPGFIAAMLAVGVVAIYKLGESDGAAEVQSQWDEQTKLRDAAFNKLTGEYAQLQLQHTRKVEELTNELQTSQSQHEATLLRYRDDHAKRLLLAEDRAGVYQRQASGSAVEQQRLARHAAELDRTLEEGRSLVRDLRQTLGQREVTIKALGGIILNDRTLLESH